MTSHLSNIEQILAFIVRDTPAIRMVDVLYDRIQFVVEKQITLRDAENFMAYFKFLLSATHIPKKLKFDRKLMQAFIDHTYADLDNATKQHRAQRLYEYLELKIGLGHEIGNDDIRLLEIIVAQERKPTLDKLQERARIATILKWLQGPLKDRLSREVQDHVIFLATAYGQYQTNRVFDVEWTPLEVSDEDRGVIEREYTELNQALTQAIEKIHNASLQKVDATTGQNQFRVIFDSVTNLVQLRDRGQINSIEAFRDKLIVSTTLIYIQDDFVEKDAELEQFIQLLLSLYYQFRDHRY